MPSIKYKCGCTAGGDNVASYCPIHGHCEDTNPDEFDKWLRSQSGVYPTIREIAFGRKAWNAAIESQKEKRFGCHVASPRGKIFIYAFCMYDHGYDCEWDNTKETCEFWREIEG